jgi:hypothetical protein
VLLRLLQQRTTLVDLTMDSSIRLRYRLLRECYLTFTDDFGLAAIEPRISYQPNVREWRVLRLSAPALHWRQGFVVGHLDRIVDGLIVDNGKKPRPMNYGEMESALTTIPSFKALVDLLLNFDFASRPVLGRMLMTYASLLHILMSAYGFNDIDKFGNSTAALLDRMESDPRFSLQSGGPNDIKILRPYIEERLKQATATNGYVQF